MTLVLVQWSLLLGLGWIIYGFVREGHPRQRQILWRSILSFGALLPALAWLRFPRLTVPAPAIVARASYIADSVAMRPVSIEETSSATEATPDRIAPGAGAAASIHAPLSRYEPSPTWTAILRAQLNWGRALLSVWGLGCAWQLVRLARIHIALRRVLRRASDADAGLLQLAAQIRSEFRIRRVVRLKIADGISSPFLTGLVRSTIVFPRALFEGLSTPELRAILTHELAHQCRTICRGVSAGA